MSAFPSGPSGTSGPSTLERFLRWLDSTAALIVAIVLVCVLSTGLGWMFGWLLAEKFHERVTPPSTTITSAPAATSTAVSETSGKD